MDSIYLSGSEDVRSAGVSIRSASEEINQAAARMDETFRNHQRFMDDWLLRLIQHNEDMLAKYQQLASSQQETEQLKKELKDKEAECAAWNESTKPGHDMIAEAMMESNSLRAEVARLKEELRVSVINYASVENLSEGLEAEISSLKEDKERLIFVAKYVARIVHYARDDRKSAACDEIIAFERAAIDAARGEKP